MLNHLKMLHCILNCFRFLFCTSRLPTVLRLCFVIILSLVNPMLLLYLGNIEIRHVKSVLFLHPITYLSISCLCLCTCSINLIKIDLYLDMIISFCWDRRTTVSTFHECGIKMHNPRLIR